MSWNYRVIKQIIKDETEFTIREVYYKGNGELYLVSQEPNIPRGETVEELYRALQSYNNALFRPVLNYEDFENKSEDK